VKGVAPIEVCDYILKNTPDVFNLLRKKDKDRDDFVGKLKMDLTNFSARHQRQKA